MTPSKQFNSSNGTAFVVDGKTVEITRADQPICRVPLSDIFEFSTDKSDGGNIQNKITTAYFRGGERRCWTCPNCGQLNRLTMNDQKKRPHLFFALLVEDPLSIACQHCKDATLITLCGDVSLVAHNPRPEDSICGPGLDFPDRRDCPGDCAHSG